jgi:hypothetical protein
MFHTTLGRTIVLSGGRSSRPRAAGDLYGKSSALVVLTLQAAHGSVSLVGGAHLDEAKASRVLGMGVPHDLALLDDAVDSKQILEVLVADAGMDACHEQVGAGVAGVFAIIAIRRSVTGSRVSLAEQK